LTGNLTAATYLFLTAVVLVLEYVQRGVTRRSGWTIIAAYLIFVLILAAVS
jgi:hypothetical protein